MHSPGIEEKIGSMLLAGFRGFNIQSQDPVARDIREHALGSVILFDVDLNSIGDKKYQRNIQSPDQLQNLNRQLQDMAGNRLLVSLDQEGGKVNRLKEKYGFPASVSARYLGLRDNTSLTREHAEAMARLLIKTGFNWNHAPVVDLNVNPGNPVIGKIERSFSRKPDTVTRHALEFIDAHRRHGVLTTLKHFPGHGSSTVDSHKGFTDVSLSWSEIELEPFRNIISEKKADAIMTAHVYNNRLDREYPATLSKRVITGLLREKLGFEGVVVSDDMQMGAIRKHYSLETAVRLVIEAGADILCFGNNVVYEPDIVPKVAGLILNWVKTRQIPEKRIDQSYQRIVALKRSTSCDRNPF